MLDILLQIPRVLFRYPGTIEGLDLLRYGCSKRAKRLMAAAHVGELACCSLSRT